MSSHTPVILSLIAMLLALRPNCVEAQSALEFEAQLSHPEFNVMGTGLFYLLDSSLTYDLELDFGFSLAEIRGPGSAPDAPVIFPLDLTGCIVPGPGNIGGGCFFDGNLTLTESEIDNLIDGDWYVWAHSPTAPSFSMSGHIVPEPEFNFLLIPAVITLLFLKRKVFLTSVCPKITKRKLGHATHAEDNLSWWWFWWGRV